MINFFYFIVKFFKIILGWFFEVVVVCFDVLFFVFKLCKQKICVEFWCVLYLVGNVDNLKDVFNQCFDDFYIKQQKKVCFECCEVGFIIDVEGLQFEMDGLFYWDGFLWSEWI